MGEKKKVLCVEDEQTLLMVLKDTLQKAGFQPILAKDGKEGLEAALREHPHLILLDLIMARMSGLEMLRELRVDSWGKRVPVIIFTNISDEEIEKEARSLGVQDIVIKADVSLQELIEKVNERLQ